MRRGRSSAARLVLAFIACIAALAGGAAVRAAVIPLVSEGDGTREIRIAIRYSRFEPDRIDVAAGETVRFVVVNDDPIDHEFIVGDARVQLVHEEGTEAHHPPRPGEISVPAGTTRSTTVVLDDRGPYTLFGCHLPGHYRYGMVGTISFV